MSFFDQVERPPPPAEPREHQPPPWFQPPSRHFAALVPDRRVLARAPGIAAVLSHIDVFPTGCTIRVRASMVRPDGPVLQQQGGGGGGGRGEYDLNRNLWLWPLPPPRPFDLVLEWQDQGIDETRVALDGAAIAEAAADSGPLFD